jgi:catechol 2,3-dioxygenase
MPIRSLGHAVLKVRDLDRAEQFYHGVLGLPIATRSDELKMIFFTLGNHHDFAVLAVGDDAPPPDPKGVGLFHVAFNVGDSQDDLRAMKERLEAHGVKIERMRDHNVSESLYFNDPDGNGLELYIDTSDVWKRDPSAIASGKPLTL